MTDVPLIAPHPETGTRLGEDGRYSLNHLLGTGGMASVWSAHDARLGRSVAIKIIADTLALDPAFVARFQREAHLVAGLSHPHVVQVFDYGTHGNRPYLVMDHVGGGTLADRIRSDAGRWDPKILACELLDALDYIHAAGVLHRDLKPANVLIGIDGHARLTDFGIAQLADSARFTGTGLLMGTAHYSAPEVLHGQPPSVRSDLYSLGVMLHDCAPDNAALAPVIRALTQPDPAQRPASAGEALALLNCPPTADQVTAPLPVEVQRHTMPEPVVPRRRRRMLLPLLALIAALVLIPLILFARQDSDAGLEMPTNAGPVAEQLDQLDGLIDQARR